jgi:hypothetical protein
MRLKDFRRVLGERNPPLFPTATYNGTFRMFLRSAPTPRKERPKKKSPEQKRVEQLAKRRQRARVEEVISRSPVWRASYLDWYARTQHNPALVTWFWLVCFQYPLIQILKWIRPRKRKSVSPEKGLQKPSGTWSTPGQTNTRSRTRGYGPHLLRR